MTLEPPLGAPVEFSGAAPAAPTTLEGRRVTLRPVDPVHDAAPLFEATREPSLWRYLPYGPFGNVEEYAAELRRYAASTDPAFFTIVAGGAPGGIGSLLRIVPEHGVIEVGHLLFSPQLQRTAEATEAIYLLAAHVFDRLGYRRLEWKCNALNAASRRAAERFGFRYEGTFAQHMVVKGRNRDSAWFAITDGAWPVVKAGFQRWLDPANFDSDGQQLIRLDDLRGR